MMLDVKNVNMDLEGWSQLDFDQKRLELMGVAFLGDRSMVMQIKEFLPYS